MQSDWQQVLSGVCQVTATAAIMPDKSCSIRWPAPIAALCA